MENLLCGVIMEDEASFSFWRYAPVYVFGFVCRDYGEERTGFGFGLIVDLDRLSGSLRLVCHRISEAVEDRRGRARCRTVLLRRVA